MLLLIGKLLGCAAFPEELLLRPGKIAFRKKRRGSRDLYRSSQASLLDLLEIAMEKHQMYIAKMEVNNVLELEQTLQSVNSYSWVSVGPEK